MKLLETIRFENGRFENLAYHQQRMNRSRKMLLRCAGDINLPYVLLSSLEKFVSSGLQIRMQTEDGLFKCRIIYSTSIKKTDFIPYQPPQIQSLKIVVNDKIEYSYKYLDRKALEKLLKQKKDCDDILIVKNGLITDTSFANILFFNGKEWLTPALPLLKGTRRAQLLDEEKIRTADIRIEDLKHFQKARLINAMMRFEDHVDVPVEYIKP